LTQVSEISSAFEGGQVNLACFEVGGRVYALDVPQLREIVRWQEITPLPMAPELIEGVIDLRGAVIPVIDLGRALGGDVVNVSTRARIVVLECDGLVFGLCVEAAVEVLSLAASALEDPPALAVQAGYEAVRAVVRREGSRPVLVLSLENILESVYRSAIRNQGEVR
jgi:purine-binding chemotaxis protein CheW